MSISDDERSFVLQTLSENLVISRRVDISSLQSVLRDLIDASISCEDEFMACQVIANVAIQTGEGLNEVAGYITDRILHKHVYSSSNTEQLVLRLGRVLEEMLTYMAKKLSKHKDNDNMDGFNDDFIRADLNQVARVIIESVDQLFTSAKGVQRANDKDNCAQSAYCLSIIRISVFLSASCPILAHQGGGTFAEKVLPLTLIPIAIELLHVDVVRTPEGYNVFKSACSVLVLIDGNNTMKPYCKALYETLTAIFEAVKKKVIPEGVLVLLLPLIGHMSKQFPMFAFQIGKYFLSESAAIFSSGDALHDNDVPVVMMTLKMLDVVTRSCHLVVPKLESKIQFLLKDITNVRMSHISIKLNYLAGRLSLSMLEGNGQSNDVSKLLEKNLCRHAELLKRDKWGEYKLGCRAVISSRPVLAHHIFESLANSASSEQSFLWLKALENISEAGKLMIESKAIGIPGALTKLSLASTMLMSLEGKFRGSPMTFQFQLEVIDLQIDFLNLCMSARGLAGEMQLTGVATKSFKRTHLHQKNIGLCFAALADRYRSMYQRHCFNKSYQTKTSIISMSALCRFLAIFTGGMIFGEMPPPQLQNFQCVDWPDGEGSYPSIQIVNAFNENVVKPLEGRNLDSCARSHTLREVLDLMLKTPLPFPSNFFTIEKSANTAPASLFVSADPLDVDRETPVLNHSINGNSGKFGSDMIEVIENTCGMPCDILVCGKIPERYFLSETSFSSCGSVEITHSLEYDSPLYNANEETDTAPIEEDESMELNEDDEDEQIGKNVTVHRTSLLPGGAFLTKVECLVEEEGYFFAKFKLNYIDPKGCKWNVPIPDRSGELFIKSSFT
uniref:Integrator complex subunit 7 helical bundle domain-containing protein n=1 Tax=Leptocylindrus danicus TaxID=163516 RepID=A0A7S2L0M9_9STRA